MKNKKNIYILLPAVLIIWGILLYKIIGGLSPDAQTLQIAEQGGKFTPKIIKQTDTFSIQTNYRDPFLGTFKQKKKRTVRPHTKTPVIKKEKVPFPTIVYKGIVSPKGKNKNVFLISVNGQQHLFKRNTTFNNVKLLQGNAQKITVQFQHQKRTFPLAK